MSQNIPEFDKDQYFHLMATNPVEAHRYVMHFMAPQPPPPPSPPTAMERAKLISEQLETLRAYIKRLERERDLLMTKDGAALWNVHNGIPE